MRLMRTVEIKRGCVGLFCLAFALLLSGCATPMNETPAVLVKSAQFEIFSTMSAEKTKALALELERFHALIYATTNAPRVPPVVPTRIYAFERKPEYARFTPARNSLGVFISGLRENRILLTGYSRRVSASRVILHEYVHFVLDNGAITDYPIWYNEGFADFLSTVETYDDDQIALGAFPKDHLPAFQRLGWVPLRRIIAASSYDDLRGNDKWMLYPESWALVHYLFLDREAGARTVNEEIADYLTQVKSGVAPHLAFEAAFGETTDSASRNIQRILERRKLRVIAVPIASLDYDASEPSVQYLTQAEVAGKLGWLSFFVGEFEEAEAEFRVAIEGNPNDSRLFVGLADSLKSQDRLDEAEKTFDRALEIDPDNALNQLDYGEFLEYVARQTEYGEERSSLLARARAAYTRSHALDASIPETLAVFGHSYLAAGEKAAMGYPMVLEALKMMPANSQLLGMMAEAAFAVGNTSEARQWLTKRYGAKEAAGVEKAVEEHLQEFKESREKQEAIARGEDPDS